jgi:hypothetical protein
MVLAAPRRQLSYDVHLVPALRQTVLVDPHDTVVEVQLLDGPSNALPGVVHGPNVPVPLLVAGPPDVQLPKCPADAPEIGRRVNDRNPD